MRGPIRSCPTHGASPIDRSTVSGASLGAFRAGFGAALFAHAASKALAGAFALHTLLFLQDAASYNNHEYLLSLLCFVLALVPSGAAPSIDRRAPADVPAWSLRLLRFQIGAVYVFGGIAKLDTDWLLRAEPLRIWLSGSDVPAFLRTPEAAYFIAWAGLAFDLAIVPALLHPRTQAVALAAAGLFHLTNAWLFDIGVFPWLMMFASTVFLAPDWPLRARLAAGSAVGTPAATTSRLVRLIAAIHVALQLVIPLRRFAHDGVTSWTEQGHRFAWRMKLRHKSGTIRFEGRSKEDGRAIALERYEALLEVGQRARVAHEPDLIRQLGRALGERARLRTGEEVEVHVHTSISLNGHPAQPLIRPDVNLVTLSPWAPAPAWIVPFSGGQGTEKKEARDVDPAPAGASPR